MIDNKKSNNTLTVKIIYSAIIILAAVGYPLYFLFINEVVFKVNKISIFFTILYFVPTIGFIFFVFDIKGINVTTKETDQKIAEIYEKARDLRLFLALLVMLWLAYPILLEIYT